MTWIRHWLPHFNTGSSNEEFFIRQQKARGDENSHSVQYSPSIKPAWNAPGDAAHSCRFKGPGELGFAALIQPRLFLLIRRTHAIMFISFQRRNKLLESDQRLGVFKYDFRLFDSIFVQSVSNEIVFQTFSAIQTQWDRNFSSHWVPEQLNMKAVTGTLQVDWWLQPCAVFCHSFSGISWHMPQK